MQQLYNCRIKICRHILWLLEFFSSQRITDACVGGRSVEKSEAGTRRQAIGAHWSRKVFAVVNVDCSEAPLDSVKDSEH